MTYANLQISQQLNAVDIMKMNQEFNLNSEMYRLEKVYDSMILLN